MAANLIPQLLLLNIPSIPVLRRVTGKTETEHNSLIPKSQAFSTAHERMSKVWKSQRKQKSISYVWEIGLIFYYNI